MKRLFILILSLFITSASFSQERRLALVIGNADYANSGELKNPVNDANLMAKTLEELGFTVIKKLNASKTEMEATIYDFSRKLSEYNVALFYYAGHGIQVEGNNYLIPTDARLNDKLAAQFEAVDVSKVVAQFERYPDNINIVILDACRNNPFKTWTRGGNSGFKAIPAPSGTIIAFATGEGATASDGSGGNGLYTANLVEEMKKPQRIEDVFIGTRNKVREMSNNEQSPQEWSQLTGKFFFNDKGAPNPNATQIAQNETVREEPIVRNNNNSEKKGPIALDRGKMKSAYEVRAVITDLLDFGYSVIDVLNSGVAIRHMYGISYQGGIIVDIDEENNTGLIAAPFDQARGAKVTWEKAREICEELALDDYSDWSLPTKAQLSLLYENLKKSNYGDFISASYWSSSESGYNNAWGQSFSSGGRYDFDKFSEHHVRAVRSFKLEN